MSEIIDDPDKAGFPATPTTKAEAVTENLAIGDDDRVGTFGSLRVRNFRLFFAGQLISQVGNWMTLIAQTLLVLRLTDSGLALGLLAACQFGPVLVLGVWTGLVADRSDKRRLLITVQGFAMAQSFVLAALAFMDDTPVVAIYAVALLGGVATAFDNPARRAFVVEMVPASHVHNAVSLNSALMTGARILGPAFAGLMISLVGFGWTFVADGVSYVAVILGLRMMKSTEMRPPAVTQRGKGQIREGLRYVRRVPDLFVPLVMMAIVGTFAFNFQTVIPLFVTRSLGGGESAFTILYTLLSVGSLAAALLSARRSKVDVRAIVIASMCFGASLMLLAVAPNLASAFGLGIAVGFGSIMFMTANNTIVQLRADPSMRGRVLALQAIVFLGSTPIGGPILGWICEQFGARAGVAVGGASAFVAAGYGWRATRFERADVVERSPMQGQSVLRH